MRSILGHNRRSALYNEDDVEYSDMLISKK